MMTNTFNKIVSFKVIYLTLLACLGSWDLGAQGRSGAFVDYNFEFRNATGEPITLVLKENKKDTENLYGPAKGPTLEGTIDNGDYIWSEKLDFTKNIILDIVQNGKNIQYTIQTTAPEKMPTYTKMFLTLDRFGDLRPQKGSTGNVFSKSGKTLKGNISPEQLASQLNRVTATPLAGAVDNPLYKEPITKKQ